MLRCGSLIPSVLVYDITVALEINKLELTCYILIKLIITFVSACDFINHFVQDV